MALKITRGEKPHGMLSDRRLYLTADRGLVVEDGDGRAAYLFATEGFEISAGVVEQYGLSLVDGKVVLPAAETEEVAGETGDQGDGGEGGDELPEWPLETEPEDYLERYPDGPNSELARQILAARDESGSGGS